MLDLDALAFVESRLGSLIASAPAAAPTPRKRQAVRTAPLAAAQAPAGDISRCPFAGARA